MRSYTFCKWKGGCSELTNTGSYCEEHAKEREVVAAKEKAERDRTRTNSNDRGYTYRYRKAREVFLKQHPLCNVCATLGATVAAVVVDHIVPHKGDPVLFWDRKNNWQPLCEMHHNQKTATEDGRWGNPKKEG